MILTVFDNSKIRLLFYFERGWYTISVSIKYGLGPSITGTHWQYDSKSEEYEAYKHTEKWKMNTEQESTYQRKMSNQSANRHSTFFTTILIDIS